MKATLTSVNYLEPFVGAYCAATLCRPLSDMQSELYQRLAETPIVLIETGLPIAWVASHEWRDQQTLEAFVVPEWRRRGLVKLGAHMLLAASYLVKTEPVAVFSSDCVPLARSLGFHEVRHYTRHGKDWVLHLG